MSPDCRRSRRATKSRTRRRECIRGGPLRDDDEDSTKTAARTATYVRRRPSTSRRPSCPPVAPSCLSAEDDGHRRHCHLSRRRHRRLGGEDDCRAGRWCSASSRSGRRLRLQLLYVLVITLASRRCRSFRLTAIPQLYHHPLPHAFNDGGRHPMCCFSRTCSAPSSLLSRSRALRSSCVLLKARRRGDPGGSEAQDDDTGDDEDLEQQPFDGPAAARRRRNADNPIGTELFEENSSGMIAPNLSWVLRLEDTSRRLEGQVRHLTHAVQSLQRTVDQTTRALNAVQHQSGLATSEASHNPQGGTRRSRNSKRRARLFIDGTWLYYGLYEREREMSPISRRFGSDWLFRYAIDWAKIPAVVENHLRHCNNDAAQPSPAAIEIVSSTVFTSYKPDTSPASLRYKMFEGLREAGFDVRMMETLGETEKCVDIALAVELIHADCDVALILTGDKDFLPAMVRTRSPTKELGLVSMRRSCNRALYETPTGPILDYNVVWLDDYVDQFVVPIASGSGSGPVRTLSGFTLIKILNDYIDRSPTGQVSSRDVGRYLKSLELDSSTTVSDEVKSEFGSLRLFLRLLPDVYKISDVDAEAKDDRSFLIELVEGTAAHRLHVEAKRTVLSSTEKQFFDRYNLRALDDVGNAYGHTSQLLQIDTSSYAAATAVPSVPDYSSWTVAQLKDLCRERNLPVSGVKSVLVERLVADERDRQESTLGQETVVDGRGGVMPAASQPLVDLTSVPQSVSQYLEGLVVEYLTASGGQASSRDVGRYLVANKSSTGNMQVSALKELKKYYSSVAQFIQTHSHIFRKGDMSDDASSKFAFPVSLVKDVDVESVKAMHLMQ